MIESLVSTLVGPITGLISKFVPDKDKAAALAHDIATLADKQAHDQIIAQIKVNEEQAKHPSLFVSGARPFILWVCGIAMANNYLIVPYAVAAGLAVPSLDLGEMMPVLMGILGLGGMRSFDRSRGVARLA